LKLPTYERAERPLPVEYWPFRLVYLRSSKLNLKPLLGAPEKESPHALTCARAEENNVTSIPNRSPADKPPQGGPDGQRTFLISALRAASARARLATNTFDTIGTALRERMISADDACLWLRDEGLLAEVEWRPGMASKAAKQ
jgi:hypothetical protein